MCSCLEKACPALGGYSQDFDINISYKPKIYSLHNAWRHKEHMSALIAHHGSALAALATVRQQPEAQRNVVYREVLKM
jgi:hypothetical protein